MVIQETIPIFRQIAERISDEILTGTYGPGERLPSVREYAALMQVNPNTVMRSYDYLASHEVIFNRRGIGYFVADDAPESIRRQRTRTLLDDQLNTFFTNLDMLGITPEQLTDMYRKFLQK